VKDTSHSVDAHCHVDLLKDWQNVMRHMEASRQFTFAVTTTPKAWVVEREVSQSFRYVQVGAGLHPQVVHDRMNELPELERAIAMNRFVGEVGLDASPAHRHSLSYQRRVLRRVFSLCSEIGGRVISLHSLRAADQVLAIAEETRVYEENTLIFHWFTGSSAELGRALDMRAILSVNADMLSSAKGRSHALAAGPLRTLTESDAPFAKGHPLVNGVPSVDQAISSLAACWNTPDHTVAQGIADLAKKIWWMDQHVSFI
jgi:TatD DNase family protein